MIMDQELALRSGLASTSIHRSWTFLLYANFRMALGLDINLSQAPPGYVCSTTGRPPGNNRSSRGPTFAGFRGELSEVPASSPL